MNPYRRAATFLIRIVAISMIFFGATLFFFDGAKQKVSRRTPARVAPVGGSAEAQPGLVKRIVSRSLPWLLVITGVPLLVGSSALARRLTEDLDDEEPPSET